MSSKILISTVFHLQERCFRVELRNSFVRNHSLLLALSCANGRVERARERRCTRGRILAQGVIHQLSAVEWGIALRRRFVSDTVI
jgi:hypothetical protein